MCAEMCTGVKCVTCLGLDTPNTNTTDVIQEIPNQRSEAGVVMWPTVAFVHLELLKAINQLVSAY